MSETLAHELYNGMVKAKEVYRAEAHRIGAENGRLVEEIARLRARLAGAEKVITGVVNSYPVAAGTSKYGYEEDHDGYGWIRECRLWLEATPSLASQELQQG
jgi:hypothetical protein